MQLIKNYSVLNQIEKKLFLFFISFLSTQMLFLNSRLVFLIPILCLAFVIGRNEVMLCVMGISIGSLFLRDVSLFVAGGLFVVMLYLLIPIYSIKTRFVPMIASLYLFLIELIFYAIPINQAIVHTMITLYTSIIMVNNASCLVHDRKNYSLTSFYFIGLLLFYIIYPINQFSSVFFMVWLRLLVLTICYVSSFQISYKLSVTISILLLLNNTSMLEEVMMFLIPYSLFHMFVGKTKLSIAVFYILSHLIVPFLTTGAVRAYIFEVVFSSISFMLIPAQIQLLCEKEIDENRAQMQITSAQRKLSRQLENYSDLYFKIAHSFDDMKVETSVLSYMGFIQENLCKQCINHGTCLNKQRGDHRLIKLMKKGIINHLNKEEQHYVENYCLHMAQYKKLMSDQHKLYHHQKDMNEEYEFLKHHLYDQLYLVGTLLKNYADHIEWSDTYHEDHIKELLEAYHYKIWHIQKENLSLQTFNIELGMTEITKHEVYEVVVPIIEKAMDTKLRILKIENDAHQLGYTHVLLSNHHHYDLVYGFQQISKDRDYCGDSYLTFQHHSNTLVAISDGMGFGKKAHKESQLTLDVFSRLLKSGIRLDECVQTVNALLKIKNRVEMFTTLDIFMFDTSIGEGTFIKNGSMPSYIYRSHELIKIEPNTLPIGIVNNVQTYQRKEALHEDDVIIMLSDGFEDGIEDVLKVLLKQHYFQAPQFIADQIINNMLAEEKIDDDATIVVLKIKKVSS